MQNIITNFPYIPVNALRINSFFEFCSARLFYSYRNVPLPVKGALFFKINFYVPVKGVIKIETAKTMVVINIISSFYPFKEVRIFSTKKTKTYCSNCSNLTCFCIES